MLKFISYQTLGSFVLIHASGANGFTSLSKYSCISSLRGIFSLSFKLVSANGFQLLLVTIFHSSSYFGLSITI